MTGESPDAVKRYNIIKTGNTVFIYSIDVQIFVESLVVKIFRKNQKSAVWTTVDGSSFRIACWLMVANAAPNM